MKKFFFPLEQIRAWNATKLQIEETGLESLVERQRQVEAAFAEVCAERTQFEQQTLRQTLIEASQLARIEQFRAFAVSEGSRLLATRTEFGKRAAEIRSRIIELKRKIELLDRLRERQRDTWTAEETKELQTAADEAFLQKLVAKRV